MDLSIIIPYYNADNYISECLESLIDQDIPSDDYEILVIDDGSSAPKDVLMSYVDNYSNIHYYYQENSRQGAARNNGIRRAKGDFVIFVDADDVVVRNRLSLLLDYVKNNDLDILFFGVSVLSSRGFVPLSSSTDSGRNLNSFSDTLSGLDYIVKPFLPWLFNPTQYIINRSFLLNYSILFPEKWLIREDWAFLLDILIPAKRVAATNWLFYYYIENPGSIIHSVWSERYSQDIINYLNYTRRCIDGNPSLSTHTALNVVNGWIDESVFILLGKMAKYSQPELSRHYIDELKQLGFYPFSNRDGSLRIKFVKYIMNSRFVWLTFCHIISHLRHTSSI